MWRQRACLATSWLPRCEVEQRAEARTPTPPASHMKHTSCPNTTGSPSALAKLMIRSELRAIGAALDEPVT